MGKFSLRIHLKSLEIDRVSIYNVNNGIKSRKEYIVSTINNIKFVNAWVDACNRSAGVKSVASKLDLTVEQASAKANSLRKMGVELPAMPRVRDYNDVEMLNNLIAAKYQG